MSQQELWQWIHYSYGEELGLTTSDEADYIALSSDDKIQFQMQIQREEKQSEQNVDYTRFDNPSNKVSSFFYCTFYMHFLMICECKMLHAVGSVLPMRVFLLCSVTKFNSEGGCFY